MLNAHKCEKTYSCTQCEKTFYLRWRFQKHVHVHDEGVKKCKYIQSGHNCPYNDVDCMFNQVGEPEEISNIVEDDEIIEEDNF